MRIIIAGSRGITDPTIVDKGMRSLITKLGLPTEIVSGGAKGVDELGERWAKQMGIPVKRFDADWDTYRKAAGPKRNRQMAEYADALLLVWDGTSRGSWNMLVTMRQLGKPAELFRWPPVPWKEPITV